MEEKWWSKFQTKSTEESSDADEYLSVDDIKEVVSGELNEKLDDVVKLGKKTTEEVVSWANEKIEQQPELKAAVHSTKEKVSDVVDWANDAWQKPRVQEVVDNVTKKTEEVWKSSVDAVDDLKMWTTDTLEKPEVKEAFASMKETTEDVVQSGSRAFEEAKAWTQETWKRPEVQETVASAKDLAADAVEAGKKVVDQTLVWATEIKNRPEVQETVQSVRLKSKEVADDVKESVERVVRDPRVQKNVENVKTNVHDFGTKASRTYDDLKGSALREELREFKDVAWKFGKQSARVVVTTVEEIRNNETVIATVEKGKEVSKDLLERGVGAIRNFLAEREERKARQRYYEQEWEYDVRRRPAKEEMDDDDYEDVFVQEWDDEGLDESIESDESIDKSWGFDDTDEEK